MAVGCGAWWIAHVENVDGNRYRLSAVADGRVREAAVVVGEATDNAQTAVTAAADKWVPGVVALLGLAGVATAVVARDAVSALPMGWRVFTFVLVCLAVVGSAASTVFVYKAAYGWPERVRFTSTANVLQAAAKLQESITGIGGKCLDVAGGSTAAGARLQLWSCNDSGAQRWTM